MTFFQQLKAARLSPIVETVGQAYFWGWTITAITMIVPHFATIDYVSAVISFWKDCLSNPAWLFIFFKSTMNVGIGFVLGALQKTNAFDKVKQYFYNPTPETINPGPRLTDLSDK